jgi:predicted metal-dependent hydrolase
MSRRTAPLNLLQRSLFDEPEPEGADASPPESLSGEVFKHPRAQRDVRLDGHLVAYEMRRARRRSIGFVVGPEGLSVSVPRWVGAKEVDSALHEKRGWILRKLREQRERAARLQSARIDWRDGTELPFLGDTLILVLDARTTGAVLDNGAEGLPGVARRLLRIGLPHTATPEQIRDAVQSWLQRQARRVFEERCALFAQRLNVRVRRMALSSAATRWGSANADGSIRLNWRLVHFGLPIIDYVVAHELAHLREMNHSPAFWDVVRSVLPDYEHSRVALRDGQVPVFD